MSQLAPPVQTRPTLRYMIIAISVMTRTGNNERIRLDLDARYIRFLDKMVTERGKGKWEEREGNGNKGEREKERRKRKRR